MLSVQVLAPGSVISQDAACGNNWVRIEGEFRGIDAIWFFDRQHGVVAGSPEGEPHPAVWLTSDGGITWRKANTPGRRPWIEDPGVSSLYFKDRLNGWAGVVYQDIDMARIDDTIPGVWRTYDGGLNWIELPGLRHFGHMLVSGKGIVVMALGGVAAVDSVRILANVWQTYSHPPISKDTILKRSFDGGATWEYIPSDPNIGHFLFQDMYGHKANGKIFACLRSNYTHKNFYVYSTPDLGYTWDSVEFPSKRSSLHEVDGFGNVIYLSATEVLRSDNGGTSFFPVGGPGDIPHFYPLDVFSVPPSCNGGLVFATGRNAEEKFALWVSTNGGDGTLPTSCPPAIDIHSLFQASACAPSTGPMQLTNRHCDTLTIEGIAITNGKDNFVLDQNVSSFKLANTEVKHFDVTFLPGAPTQTLTGSLAIKGYFSTTSGKRLLDTVITLRGITFSDSLGLESDKSKLSFGDVNNCDGCDTTITITNLSCDTARIVSQDLTGTGFTFDPLTLPVVLAPGQTQDVRFACTPQKSGETASFARFISSLEGSAIPDTIDIELKATANVPPLLLELTQDTIDFGTISLCNPDTTTIEASNLGCDSLFLEYAGGDVLPFTISGLGPISTFSAQASQSVSIVFHPEAEGSFERKVYLTVYRFNRKREYELVLRGNAMGVPPVTLSSDTVRFLPITTCEQDSSQITILNQGCDSMFIERVSLGGDAEIASDAFQAALAPGSVYMLNVKLLPITTGQKSATIRIRTRSRDVTRDTVIYLLASVRSAARTLAQSVTQMDFGTLDLCAVGAKVVTITNGSCEPLTITEADITGSFEHDGDFPIVLNPQETRTITVTTLIDTVGGNMTSTGLLRFTSNADNTLPAITLSRGYKYPRTIDLTLTVNGSGSAHESEDVRMTIAPIGDMTDVERVSFDLVYDSDLLSNISLSTGSLGAVSRDADGLTRQRIAIDAPLGVSLTELEFSTRLAVRAVTPIRIENIRLNETDPDFGNCVARVQSATGGEFSYLYNCGDRELQNFLRDGSMPFSIVSLRPNPVSDMLTVDLDALTDVSVTVIDALGKKVMTSRSSSNKIELDTRGLSDGLYFLEITAQGSQQVRSFVKR